MKSAVNELHTHPEQRVADLVAATLQLHGVRHAFGMPGGEVVTLIDGLLRAGIEFHLARHESAAALMTAGASVTSAAPQALVTTVGPGLANAVNGIADAAQERVPLIVLSGIVDRPTRARYTHQVIDQARLLAPLVKGSFEIEPESAAATVARAVALATSEPMGPVHLDISPATAAMIVKSGYPIAPSKMLRPSVTSADPTVRAVLRRLREAQRPLIISGFEAARMGAGPQIVALAEAVGSPVVTTYKAKGLISEDHHLSLGAAGLSPTADAFLLPLVDQADLVIAIGYDPIEMRLGWLDFVKDPDTLIDITAAPADHGMHHSALRVITEIASFTNALAHAAGRRETWSEGEPERVREVLRHAFARQPDWGPHAIIEALNDEAGADSIVTVDSGAHRILLSQMWKAHKPLTLMQSAGFCTMAAALPLAIGTKVADPDRRVFAVMGDGGLEMGIGELATLRDLGLPITIVLFQDQSLALIALKQAALRLTPAGVALGMTDFAAVAKGFGGYGINVETIDDLRDELASARNRAGFTLICCRFSANAYEGAF